MSKKNGAQTRELITQPAGESLIVNESLPLGLIIGFEQDAGTGFEKMTLNDMAIAFITILQSGSPQVKRGDQKIEGAEEGDVFNTVIGEVYNGQEGIYVIPCWYKRCYVEWVPREQGGGFIKMHEDESILETTIKDTVGKDILPNGNIIVPTAYHYVLVVNPLNGDYTEGVISMVSTQLKKSRKWNSLMMSLKLTKADGTKFTPPMFGNIYHLTTKSESNDLGQWMGWNIEFYSQVTTIDLYKAAKKFSGEITKGQKFIVPQSEETSTNSDVPF